MAKHHRVVIAGGGTAGITVAAQLLEAEPGLDVAIVEPASKHYYQPLWTLVGGGVFSRETTEREEADLIPHGATWIKDRVGGFDPDRNLLTTAGGEEVGYDFLVVALGIKINWDAIPGLAETVGKDGVVSNYSYDTCETTWAAIRSLREGKALFTHPSTPIKCGGAPLKICFLAEDHFRRSGVRSKTQVRFFKGGGAIFAVKKYADALTAICAKRDIETNFNWDLKELRPAKKEAVFRSLAGEEERVESYDMIHVSPPMGPLEVQAPLGNEEGWVAVDKHDLRHERYPNVFALGDCSSLPTSKTGAAIRKQAPVVSANLRAALADRELSASYDGYTSCPLVTGYGK
ncbi:MAG TPA: pyridine nucleotide-disulfide oxidoreductase, partial [Planctomycetes bacterium]|nr:pyridine nucleotide-disulfide oxidoreductase [Planctomycetota bacterium]